MTGLVNGRSVLLALASHSGGSVLRKERWKKTPPPDEVPHKIQTLADLGNFSLMGPIPLPSPLTTLPEELEQPSEHRPDPGLPTSGGQADAESSAQQSVSMMLLHPLPKSRSPLKVDREKNFSNFGIWPVYPPT